MKEQRYADSGGGHPGSGDQGPEDGEHLLDLGDGPRQRRREELLEVRQKGPARNKGQPSASRVSWGPLYQARDRR